MPITIWIGVFAVVFVAFYFIFSGLGKVKYEGLTFVKERYGEEIIYHYSYVTKLDDGYRKVEILLRGDPRKNNVSVDGEIFYPEGKKVYLSLNNTGLEKCEYVSVALATLSIFMSNNGIQFKAGIPNKEEAEEKNLSYVSCKNYPANVVLLLEAGNESKIGRTSEFCYELEVANCEIMPVIEKFIVQSIIDAGVSKL